GAYSPKSLAYHLLFYVKHLPAVALPWTPFTALALWQAWRTGGFRDPRLRFLLCWAAAPLDAFTPAEWKLRYYLLPSLPALALVSSQRDSLKPFARAVAARYPPPAALAFWRDPIRPVAVYVGRPLPTYRRREELLPGLALVGSESALRDLLRAGVVGFPTLSAEGRLGNVARGRVVLLEVAAGRATAVGSPRSPSSAAERASRRS